MPALAGRMHVVPPGNASMARPEHQTVIFLVKHATPDVSSTAVRARLQRGEPLAGLVPPLV